MDQAGNNPGTLDCSPEDLAENIRQEFSAALQKVRTGGTIPVIEDYASQAAEKDRPKIRKMLEKIQNGMPCQEDSSILLGNGLDAPKDGESTKNEAGDTLNEAPPQAPKEHESPPHSDQTIALSPSAKPQIDSTMQFVPDSLGGDYTYIAAPNSTPKKHFPRPEVTGYEILGELGRGGMGVVYKARHKKLHRIVALKMVLSGGHASQDQLDRFLIEAEAVAQLQHPNIVQIYEIGEHDNLPYFSLEYVDGGTLSGLINGKPMPVHQAAEMAEWLSLAMSSAHNHGIIHRDLKPANILLNKDGIPKITDFGLAKKLESDSSQTKDGSLMGTPSYMAPEQASGDTKEIGPLADVYALGVILYEMLIGRPPFVGTSIIDTLRQVQKLEPVAPRNLVPNIPIDLETICLKCLQKEPQKRYATAEALAGDLHRFLAGEPILARPVGNAERLYRWCRRNPGIATLTGAIGLLLVAMTIGSVSAALVINKEKLEALNAKEFAEQKQKEAEEAELKADEHARIAEIQAGLALDSLGTLVDDVQKQIGDTPRLQPLKVKLLKTALDGFKKVTESKSSSNMLNRRILMAYVQMGDISRQVGQTQEAFKQYQQCFDIAKEMESANPDNDIIKENLAIVLTKLGEIGKIIRPDPKATMDYYQQALAIYKGLVENPGMDASNDPKYDMVRIKRGLAESHLRLGTCFLEKSDFTQALDQFQTALNIREELNKSELPGTEKGNEIQLDLARSYESIARVNFRRNPSPKGTDYQDYFEKSLKIREDLVKSNKDNPRFKMELVGGMSGYLDILTLIQGWKKAELIEPKYLMFNQELVQIDPSNTNYQKLLGYAYSKIAAIAIKTNDKAKAKKNFLECQKVRKKLSDEDPKNLSLRLDLLVATARCGSHAEAVKLAEKIRNEYKEIKAPMFYIQLSSSYSQNSVAEGISPEEKTRFTDQALADLKKAISLGFKDRLGLEDDIDMVPIKNDPRFKPILDTIGKSR